MLKRIVFSFSRAWQGLKTGWCREYSLKVFALIAGLVVIGILVLHTSRLESAILILTISVMFSLELLNSQIERFLDLVSPQKSQLVKEIKDLSAGAVLVVAMGAVIIGFLIFLPHLVALLR